MIYNYTKPPYWPWALNQDSSQAKGLAAWYPFGLGGGNVVFDQSRNRNELSIAGTGLSWGAGHADNLGGLYNSAADASSYAALGSGLLSTEPLTLSCWFWAQSDSTTQTLVSIGDEGGTGFWRIALRGGQPGDPISAQKQNNAGTSGIADSPSGYSLRTWHHGCGVFTSATLRAVYLDAVNKGTNTTNVSNPTSDETYIGRNVLSAARTPMNGGVADVRIYAVALSDAEVWALYDPASRFDLFYPLGQRVYSLPPVAAAATTRGQVIVCG